MPLALLCALLLAPCGLAAAGASSRLEIQAALGFSETFRLGYWAPLTVTVSNHGDHLLGELQVRLTYRDALKDAAFTKTHRRSLDLSRDSRKRIRFTVFLEAFAVPLEIRIVSDGRELARRSIDLRRKFTQARLLLVLSRDANLDYLNDASGERLRVLYPHPELLPDHWQGYDAVSAVIVHGVSLENLSRRQFDALRKWLAQGGRLAVSGGPDYSLLRRPRLAELLPASPAGLVTVTDAQLGLALGEPLAAQAPFHVHRLVANRGRVLYRAGSLPLVVEQANGRGYVSYLSFDVASPPFDRWAGMQKLWPTLLQIQSHPDPFARRELRRVSPVPAVLDRPAGSWSGHGTMLMFLMLYLGILATVYSLRPMARKSQRMLLGLLLACPLLFAPAAYLLFGAVVSSTGTSVVIASVIEPFESGPYARLSLDLGLFSKQRHALRLEFDTPEPGFIANHRAQRWGTQVNYSVNETSGRSLEIPDTRAYVLHMFQAQDIIPYDVKVSGVRTDEGMQLTIHNNTGQSWQDAWLVSANKLYRLGVVTHDEGSALTLQADTVHVEFESDSWSRAFLSLTAPESLDAHMAGTALVAAMRQLVSELRADEALLAAIVPSPIRLGKANASWRRRVFTVALFRFEVTHSMHNDVAS